MKTRALVTGANGMLADAFNPLLKNAGYDIYLTDINGIDNKQIFPMDITDAADVHKVIMGINPDIIFHLAAETDVDKCELKPEHAYETNARGTENMALAAKDINALFVYISTGSVFNGEKPEPYIESDKPDPISVYGKSKFEGERIVASLLDRYYIFRAGWMIGGYEKDKKFVAKIVDLAKIKKEILVVMDKFGSPTFTRDFSKGIISVVPTEKYGLYHMANKGSCSRLDIAQKIIEYLGKKDVAIKPITSEAFPLPAPRGRSEMLSNHRLTLIGLNHMRPWQEALKEYISEIKERYE
ncbi:MAG: dTDP-4-dehydrorhamnose reductase [Candidatus Omnitrophota bacterium]|nr:dTDP-4-dehydrorhamnose reductase [Candidatus Omnitrophota bacterium]